jgi:hypothetical protein
MITISLVYLIISGLVFLYLIFKIFEYKSKIAKPETVYVDTSGIAINPPSFIDTIKNKTINFKVDDIEIKICHLSVVNGLNKIERIASLFMRLNQLFEIESNNKLDEMKSNLLKDAIFKQIVHQLYLLSKPFCKKKRKLKKRLLKLAKNDVEQVLLITEQVFDFWRYVKKLIALLARGSTLNQMVGERYTWSSYETDLTGKLIIKPRCDLSTN